MANHAQIKVLLIDDEKKAAWLYKVRLELSWGYRVTIAHSGKEGLRKLKKENLPEGRFFVLDVSSSKALINYLDSLDD